MEKTDRTKIKDLPSDQIEITRNKITAQEKKEEQDAIPKYLSKLELTDSQETEIVKDILEELELLKKEREEVGLDEHWDSLDDQYEGKISEDEDRQFNLHKDTTKVKVDKITNSIVEAFLDSDPIYSITPHPEGYRSQRKTGTPQRHLEEVAERQSDFLDSELDNVIPLAEVMPIVAHSASLKGTGWLKWSFKVKRRKKRREEVYEGQKDLARFMNNYPEPDKVPGYAGYIRSLELDRTINIVVKYWDTTYNAPYPSFVNLKDLYIRKDTEGMEGIASTRLIAEKQEYTYWELKLKEKEPNGFYNIDRLLEDKDGNKKTDKKKETFVIYECTFFYTLDDGETFEKGIFWVAEEKEVLVGSINYPYYTLENVYIPHWVKKRVPGIYQPGVGEDLTDLNVAEDALLNFVLEGAWTTNMVTPIAPETSPVHKQFLEKRWAHGVPIVGTKEDVGFLQKPQQDTSSLLGLMHTLSKFGDDSSGVSSLLTGRESELDPSAPATKTIALLEQSGKNIKSYIKTMLPSFTESAVVILNLYYQMCKEGRKYKVKTETSYNDPEDVFAEITRDDMVAQTIIEPRSLSFDFDKLNEKKEDLALYQILGNEVLFRGNPMMVYHFVRNMIKSWSPKWKAKVDEIWPHPEEIQQAEFQGAMQAVGVALQEAMQQVQAGNPEAKINMKLLMNAYKEMRMQIANPVEEKKK